MNIQALVVIVVLGSMAGCGEPFATTGGTGTGGAGGSGTGIGGGNATTSSTSASTGMMSSNVSAGSGGMGCTWTVKDHSGGCSGDSYCNVTDMCGGTGTCTPIKVAQTYDAMPVCGCDHVTYWNASTAALAGVPIWTKAACANGQITSCSMNSQCPDGSICGHDLSNAMLGCGTAASAGGACVGLPDSCEKTMALGRECLATTCTNACSLLSMGKSWVKGMCTP